MKYLGDGLYFEDDGYQVRLSTDRGGHTCEVFLDSTTLFAFFQRLEQSRGLKIKVERATHGETESD